MKRTRFLLALGMRRALTTPWRSTLVAFGVGLGVALMVAIRILNSAAASTLSSSMKGLGTDVDLNVVREGTGLPIALATQIDHAPGVAAALPVIVDTVFRDVDGAALTFLGLDLPDPRTETVYGGILRKRTLGPGGAADIVLEHAVLVPSEFAERMGLQVGSEFYVEGPRGRTPLRVGGLLSLTGIGRVFAEHLIVADLDAAARLLGRSGHVDRIDVVGDGTIDREALRQRLSALLPENASIVPPQEEFGARFHLATAFLRITSAVSIFGLLVGFFLIYNILTAALIAESDELGRLRLQGASRKDLIGLLVTQAAVQALPGILFGCGLGIVIGAVARGPFIEGLGTLTQLNLGANAHQVSWRSVVLVALLGLPTAMAASWIAVHRRVTTAPLQSVTGANAPELAESGFRLAGRVSIGLLVAATVFLSLEVAYGWTVMGMMAIGSVSALLVTGSAALVLPLARAVRRLLTGTSLVAGSVAADGLAAGWSRTAVTIAVFVLGIGTATGTATIFHSARSLILGTLHQQFRGDIVVSSAFRSEGWLPAPVDAALASDIRSVPGVRGVETERLLSVRFRDTVVTIRAGELAGAGDEGGRNAPAVLVSRNLAQHFELTRGQQIELHGPDGTASFRVAGVVDDFASAVGSVVMDRRQLAALAHDDLVNYISVVAEPGYDITTVIDGIRTRAGARYRLRILPLREFLAGAEAIIGQVFKFTYAVTIIVLLVATVSLLQSIVSGALERRRVLSIMRAVGASRRHLRRAFLVEGTGIGLIGGGLGLLAGVLLSVLWVPIHLRYLLGWCVPLEWPAATYALSACLAVAWPGIAALAVARRLARLPRVADLVAE